jgi:hypothetical protein
MSIILMIFGIFIFFGLLMAAMAAVVLWVLAAASVMVFIVGAFVTSAIFGASSDASVVGGICFVLILWGVLAYMGNQEDKADSKK